VLLLKAGSHVLTNEKGWNELVMFIQKYATHKADCQFLKSGTHCSCGYKRERDRILKLECPEGIR
jgi:hypothetical protein